MLYKKILAYANGVKIYAFFALFCSFLSAFFVFLGQFYIYLILKDFILNGVLQKPLIIATCVFLTLGGLAYYFSGIYSHILGFRVEKNLRIKGVDSIMNASSSFFDTHQSGIIRKSIDDNAAMTHTAIAHLIPDFGVAVLMPIFMLVLAFIISFKVFLIVLGFVVFAFLIMKKLMGGETSFMQVYEDSLKDLSAKSVEYIRGISVIKLFDITLPKALEESILRYSDYAYKYAKICKYPYVIYEWAFLGAVPIVILVFYEESANFVLELALILLVLGVIFVSIMRIMHASSNIFSANYAINALEKICSKMQKSPFGNETHFENYEIEYKNISFSYDKTPIFKDFSLKLKEGKVYAIVGLSGSGKSTLVRLLNGSYKLSSGEILIGSKPINSYTQEALNNAISFVFQDPKLFKTSIYENIAFAKENAKHDEVMNALIHCEFIKNYKNKEHTKTNEISLSGGQKQRLSVARAMLKNSKILVFDEASSSLDIENELKILKNIKDISKDKTTILIAHRLTSLKNVDEIIVLKDAKVVERGGFAELVAKNGEFKKMLDLYKLTKEWRIS